MLENTEGAIKMNKPEKLATQDTQETGQINVREYRSGNKKRAIQRNWQYRVHKTQNKQMLENTEGAIHKGNREKFATQGTQNTEQINVREYQRGNKQG